LARPTDGERERPRARGDCIQLLRYLLNVPFMRWRQLTAQAGQRLFSPPGPYSDTNQRGRAPLISPGTTVLIARCRTYRDPTALRALRRHRASRRTAPPTTGAYLDFCVAILHLDRPRRATHTAPLHRVIVTWLTVSGLTPFMSARFSFPLRCHFLSATSALSWQDTFS
jgi:hypothetical protein